MVAPYSGHMLAMVALSAMLSFSTPGPKNSTNLPTTPTCLRCLVIVNTTSVDVTQASGSPVILYPTTLGSTIEIGWPNITASASMPPTPHPTTPRPLIIVVCESVPTTLSG